MGVPVPYLTLITTPKLLMIRATSAYFKIKNFNNPDDEIFEIDLQIWNLVLESDFKATRSTGYWGAGGRGRFYGVMCHQRWRI